MHRSIVLLSSALLAAAAPAQQAPPTRQPALPTASEADTAATARATAIGSALFMLDRAAWVATDAAIAGLTKEALQGEGGWVIEPAADRSAVVTFFRGDPARAQALFVATVREGKVVDGRKIDAPTPLTPVQLRLAAARATAAATARAGKLSSCTPAPFNSVVLPSAATDGPIAVYLLSAQLKAGEYPAGGHYRILIGADGKVVGERAFTRTCLMLTTPALPKGAKPVGMFVNHLLDQTPTEIHVFTSLTARMPLFVGTPGGRVWQVAGTRITLMRAGDAAGK